MSEENPDSLSLSIEYANHDKLTAAVLAMFLGVLFLMHKYVLA